MNKFQKYRDEASRIRGEIINCTINLERLIDECLTLYFCPDQAKALELQELIVSDRMDFAKKTDAMRTIMRKTCKSQGINFEKEYKGIKDAFRLIYEERNKFAHCQMPIPSLDEISKYKIVLLPYKDAAERVPYAQNQIDEIFERIEMCSRVIKHVYYTKVAQQSPQDKTDARP